MRPWSLRLGGLRSGDVEQLTLPVSGRVMHRLEPSELPDATASLTNTKRRPDQARYSFGRPQAVPKALPDRHSSRLLGPSRDLVAKQFGYDASGVAASLLALAGKDVLG